MIWPSRTYTFTAQVVRGKQRPRHGNGRTWTPEETKDAEVEIGQGYILATIPQGARRKAPADVPVAVHIRIRRRLSSEAAKDPDVVAEVDTRKPDIDNVAKTVLDALTGVAWEDDAQVVDLRVTREVATRREREEVEVSVTFPRTWDTGWNQVRNPRDPKEER